MSEKATAVYKTVADSGGNRYRFYCDASGACACTTKPYRANTPEEELRLAWESEGRSHFNLCHKCGKWVIDAMYNPEVFECTDCAPFEYETNFCKFCGAKVNADVRFCPACNEKLYYEGGDSLDGKSKA